MVGTLVLSIFIISGIFAVAVLLITASVLKSDVHLSEVLGSFIFGPLFLILAAFCLLGWLYDKFANFQVMKDGKWFH